MRRKIFVILSRIPYPLEKGDKLRAFYQLRELSRSHNLVICALSDMPPHPDASRILSEFSDNVYFYRLRKPAIYCRLAIAVFTALPFQVAYFYSKCIERKITKLIDKHKPDHVFCQLIRTAEYVSNIAIDKTIDYQDVFSAGLERRIAVSPWYMRPLLRIESKRVREYERHVFNVFNKKTIISEPDRCRIDHRDRNDIVVVPNGVDTDYFRPQEREVIYDVVFTGNMAYPPNVNGAAYLVKEVMPLVWDRRPAARVVIAGADPVASIKALSSDRVIVTGWVNDIREYYAQSCIFVAPMQIGTGLQNKVLEAMAMRLPCITSPLANKALNAREGDEVLIGRNAGDYAQQILSLLSDSERRSQLKNNGYSFVLKNFNWKSTTAKLEKVITA